MKKIAFALSAAVLCLTACDPPAERLPGDPVEVSEETQADIDECPRRDGEPCK